MPGREMSLFADSRYANPTVNFFAYFRCAIRTGIYCLFLLCYPYGKPFVDSCYAILSVNF